MSHRSKAEIVNEGGWEEYERKTVTRSKDRANKIRSKSKKAHSHKNTKRQKEALGYPWNRNGQRRNATFHDASVAGVKLAKSEEDRRESERPGWMSDPTLLPKRPPGQ